MIQLKWLINVSVLFGLGAPVSSDWNPPIGLEPHVPVLFLDLNPDDLSVPRQLNNVNGSFESNSFVDAFSEDLDYLSTAGCNSILPKEHGGQFYGLPIVKYPDGDDIGAVASWDSSIHDNPYLNRITETNERIYLILKATVFFTFFFFLPNFKSFKFQSQNFQKFYFFISKVYGLRSKLKTKVSFCQNLRKVFDLSFYQSFGFPEVF